MACGKIRSLAIHQGKLFLGGGDGFVYVLETDKLNVLDKFYALKDGVTSICVDDEEHFLPGALEDLSVGFSVRYNRNLELLTVRHYNEQVIENNTKGCEILLEQKTRITLSVVMRKA